MLLWILWRGGKLELVVWAPSPPSAVLSSRLEGGCLLPRGPQTEAVPSAHACPWATSQHVRRQNRLVARWGRAWPPPWGRPRGRRSWVRSRCLFLAREMISSEPGGGRKGGGSWLEWDGRGVQWEGGRDTYGTPEHTLTHPKTISKQSSLQGRIPTLRPGKVALTTRSCSSSQSRQ